VNAVNALNERELFHEQKNTPGNGGSSIGQDGYPGAKDWQAECIGKNPSRQVGNKKSSSRMGDAEEVRTGANGTTFV
jgi:hypothetical protein